ncbi:hypothetical protein ABIC29_000941 [Agromyces sp. PvR057]
MRSEVIFAWQFLQRTSHFAISEVIRSHEYAAFTSFMTSAALSQFSR